MSKAQETLDLGAMMEQSLDNIQEAPDFVTPPAGEYRLSLKESKVDKYKTKDEPDVEKQRIKNLYVVVATVSLASDSEPPVPDGSMFSETFTATEEGLGYFKKRMKAIMNVSDLAGVSLLDIMSSSVGTEFDARLTIKKSISNGKEYGNVQIRVVPPAA